MKVNTFSKIGITFGAAALLVGALAVPAQADPATGTFGQLVGLGSDTTQDVMNGIGTAVGGNLIASYDANKGSNSVVTRQGGVAIPRVSGSGNGRDELLVAIGQIANKSGVLLSDGTSTLVDSSVVGQLDFARSSGAPATNVQSADGVVAYVPFARDAVDVAVSPTGLLSKVPFFLGDGTESSTAPSLYNIYRGDVLFAYFDSSNNYVSAGKTSALPSGASKAIAIQPVLPKSGSGTRSYFLGQLKLTDSSDFTTKNPWVTDTDNGTPIEEHDGTAIVDLTSGSTAAVGPFSISQWVSQANGIVTDRRHGVTLAPLGKTASAPVAATTGTGTSYATNPAYSAMVRDVYNIVPSRLADNPSTLISKTFVGTSSTVCKQTAVIERYGFLPLTDTSGAESCGYANFRAYAASPSTVSITAPAKSTAGSSIAVTATTDSFGTGGGKVIVTNGDATLGTVTIPAGASSATGSIATPTQGALSLVGTFVPSLGGVDFSTSSVAPVTVAAKPATVSTVQMAVPTMTVGKPVTATVLVNRVDPKGGKITLTSGSSTVATATVAPGVSKVKITFTPATTQYRLVARYTSASTATSNSVSALLVTSAAKGTPGITIGAVPTVKSTGQAKILFTVTGGVTPAGSVIVTEGSTKLSQHVTLTGGRASVTLNKLKAGSHKLTITYSGNGNWNSVAKTFVQNVTK